MNDYYGHTAPDQGWTYLVFHHDTRVYTHATPPSLREDVLTDLTDRHDVPKTAFDHQRSRVGEKEYHLDLGGICRQDSPKVGVGLEGDRSLVFYAHQGTRIRDQIDSLLGNPDRFIRPGEHGTWTKLYGLHHICCVYVKTDLRAIVEALSSLRQDLERAAEDHRAWYDDLAEGSPYLTGPRKN